MLRPGMRTLVCLLMLGQAAVCQDSAGTSRLPDRPQSQPVSQSPAGVSWADTAAHSDYIPLTNHQKLNVFLKRTYSPLTFLSTAFDAGIAQAASDHPAYGQGGQGYGKRYGAAFADNESGVFFQSYLLPTIFHQDPRYYRRPELPVSRRAAYAATRTMITRNDSGRTVLNVSYLAGGLISTSIANTYYPYNERGIDDTMVRWSGGILTDSGLLVLHEFWPDISRRLMSTSIYRHLAGSKVGQKVERSVEEMSRTPEGDPPAPPPEKK